MEQAIYPCLWFNQNAQEAAAHYCTIFKTSRVLSETPMVTTFELEGFKFMGLNGGAKYTMNPAVSYYVYCRNDDEISRLYHALSRNGHILLPLDKYDWSQKYAWVEDAFGVNWQLDVNPINSAQKIVPCLLFVNHKRGLVREAINTYTRVFPNSKILQEAPYPETAGLEGGTLLFAQFVLDGVIFNAMSSSQDHDYDFSPGNSIVVECQTQLAIDHYWDTLGQGGIYAMCGWLADKYGVSWQIVPAILPRLMSDTTKSERIANAFLRMQKLDIETLLHA